MDTVQTAHLLKLDMCQFLSCEFLIHRAQSSLHDTARRAEDGTSATGVAQRHVELAVLKAVKVDVHALDQFGQLNSGNRVVHVGVAGGDELVAGTFIFLGQARHHRNHHQFVAGNAHALGPIALEHGAQHLGGRLAGRGILAQVRIIVLEEVDPCRAARGSDGNAHRLVAGDEFAQAVHNLGRLLHDRDIGAKVGIEHIVHAHLAQGRNHLARHDGARRHTELLA